MKKIFLCILLFVFAISCGNKPEEVVSKFIDNVKEKKVEEASKYVTDGDLADDVKVEYSNKIQELLFETLFKNMKYSIINVEKVDKKTTVVTVEVENVDTQKVFLTIFGKMMKHAVGEGTEKISIEDEFKNILESKEMPKTKNETQFLVVKTKKGNKIELSSDNVDVLFGRLNKTLANLDTLGDDDNENSLNSNSGNKENDDIRQNQTLTEPVINKK